MDVELQEKSDWTSIRNKLNQSYKYDEVWNKSILLFSTRQKRKYFDPIQHIINQKTLKGEGFTIVTVQCALIEMFSAFRKGKIFNPDKIAGGPKYEYKDSKQMFTSFLRSASIFQNNFWQLNPKNKITIDRPFNSMDFYKNVRCGLMHEARTKVNWNITATPLEKSVKSESIFLASEHGKIKIYRTVLHYQLLKYLKEYTDELRKDTKDGEILRKYLARKLDHLFDFLPDPAFDWWTE